MLILYLLVAGFLSNITLACLDCPPEDVDRDRGKLISLSSIGEDDYPKSLALQNRNSLDGQQQKIRFYQKALSQRIPSNLLHVYTLLKGTDPRMFVDEYLQEPAVSRISKKAEKGMLVDVVDFVTKTEDRNRRVGQNMRSSG